MCGYHIHYTLGDKWWMIESEVARYVVPDAFPSVIVSDHDPEPLPVERETSSSSGSETSDSDSEPDVFDQIAEDKEAELYLGSGVAAEFIDDDDV